MNKAVDKYKKDFPFEVAITVEQRDRSRVKPHVFRERTHNKYDFRYVAISGICYYFFKTKEGKEVFDGLLRA